MPQFPFALRAVLWLVKLGGPRRNKPVVKMRTLTFLFMRLMNRIGGIRTPGFYSVTNQSFIAAEGHTIKMKIFTPVKTTEPLPVWVYFHGGGFVLGSYIARTKFNRAIAAKANCIVVSVKYRLAPEHPFPAPGNDCYEATTWIAQHAHEFGGDGNRIAIGGESAGGNLSAVVSLMARDKGTPKILHQTLLYPGVDVNLNYPSVELYSEGYMLTKDMMVQFMDAYAPNLHDRQNPYCSPMYADLKGLPPALVITAEYDPVRDQGNLFAEKLKAAGVPVRYKCYPGMIHDFTVMMGRLLPESCESIDMIAEEVRKAFAR